MSLLNKGKCYIHQISLLPILCHNPRVSTHFLLSQHRVHKETTNMVTLLQVKDIGRLFEVDGEELRYTVEMAIHGHEQQPHLRAVLKKINV